MKILKITYFLLIFNRLNSLVDWTNEMDSLMERLQSNPVDNNEEEDASIELVQQYRSMLSRFEEINGQTNEQTTLADSLSIMLNELSIHGGVPSDKLNAKRNQLEMAISLLKNLGGDVENVMTKGKLGLFLKNISYINLG